MKFYKKVLVVALPFAFLLTGCEDAIQQRYLAKSTSQERTIVGYMRGACYSSQETVRKAIGARVAQPSETSAPFADEPVMNAIKFWDANYGCYKNSNASSFLKDITYNKVYEKAYGVPLYNNDVQITSTESEIQKPTSTESSIVVVEKMEYISPELIDKLTESVSTCFNAKVKTLELMDQNDGLLTSDNYEEVMKLVMKCKTSKLRQEVERVQ